MTFAMEYVAVWEPPTCAPGTSILSGVRGLGALTRLRGLYGAARAAALAGDRSKATTYYTKLIGLAAKGDGAREELERAKAFLAQR